MYRHFKYILIIIAVRINSNLLSIIRHIALCIIYRGKSGTVTGLEAKLDLDNTDYKNTVKLTWLANTAKAPPTPTVCVHFEHLITKGVLKPEEDFKDYANRNSKVSCARNFFVISFITIIVYTASRIEHWLIVGALL